jgi:hypothetical protein
MHEYCVCMYVCIYIYMYVHMYVCIYIYAHFLAERVLVEQLCTHTFMYICLDPYASVLASYGGRVGTSSRHARMYAIINDCM